MNSKGSKHEPWGAPQKDEKELHVQKGADFYQKSTI